MADLLDFVTLLKSCAKQKDLGAGGTIHAEIARRGLLEKDAFAGSTLVSMYAKCGALAIAQDVFDELPIRNSVSWNALITGYAQCMRGREALSCFEQMQHEGIPPNAITFASILKACGSTGALDKCHKLHAQVVGDDVLGTDTVVGNALIDTYAKCDALADAQKVFDKLQIRNVVAWTALIAGYAQHGQGKEALDCYVRMQHVGISPNSVTLLCILKACGMIGASDKGEEVHTQIVKAGLLENDMVVGTALVDMYAKCGLLEKAQELFDELSVQNVISWTALIAGYAQHGQSEKALKCFEQMQVEGLSPNATTLVCILKACSSIGAADKGQEIHSLYVGNGLMAKEIVVDNALVEMYVRCGLLGKAQEVLDELPARNKVSWNVLIAGYAQHDHPIAALNCFERMQREGLSPDVITFPHILRSCGLLKAGDKGQKIHELVAKDGLLETDIGVAIALIDMYTKCNMLGKAKEVHDKLPSRSLASWNALMVGYMQHYDGENALHCFEWMQRESFSPDGITFSSTLKACGSIGALIKGQRIHAQIARDKSLENDVVIANALVDMYAKCGALTKAQEVFDDLPVQNVVSWTALIAGYTQHGYGKKALNLFDRMQREGFSPDAFTCASILKACGSIGAADKGQDIHAQIVKDGLLKKDSVVCTALVHMYVRCGLLERAQEVFDELQVREVALWNALIGGYAHLGNNEMVFDLFDKMVEEGKQPDLITFTTLLNTCGHSGLVDKGQTFFENMDTRYGIVANLEHHNCMIDLHCRAGHFDKAVAFIKKMSFSANLAVWHTVLGACRRWGNVTDGLWAFKQAIQVNEHDATAYVCMSNIYAAAGMQEDADKIEALRVKNQAFKTCESGKASPHRKLLTNSHYNSRFSDYDNIMSFCRGGTAYLAGGRGLLAPHPGTGSPLPSTAPS